MGHLTIKDAYKSLEERINWFTQGAPPSEALLVDSDLEGFKVE